MKNCNLCNKISEILFIFPFCVVGLTVSRSCSGCSASFQAVAAWTSLNTVRGKITVNKKWIHRSLRLSVNMHKFEICICSVFLIFASRTDRKFTSSNLQQWSCQNYWHESSINCKLLQNCNFIRNFKTCILTDKTWIHMYELKNTEQKQILNLSTFSDKFRFQHLHLLLAVIFSRMWMLLCWSRNFYLVC